MCLTFQMMTLEKYLTKNYEIFLGGTPFLAPQSAASPKITTPALPMTPNYLFYAINSYFFISLFLYCLQQKQ